jgi:magnesium transporter
VLTDTGGNAGSQASVAVIRSLSLNEVHFSDILTVIWKEVRVAFFCGITLAAANFIKLLLVDGMLFHNPNVTPLVALVVCVALACTVVTAKTVGCTLPLLADKVGLDPAVVASPFITTIVDVLALLIYFGFATMLIPGVG